MRRYLWLVLAVVAVFLLGALPTAAQEGTDGEGTSKARAAGEVKSISGNTFVLATPRRGDITVQHDANTEWYGGEASDLEVGSRVGVAGTLTNSVLHAEKIGYADALKKRGMRHRLHNNMIAGEVTEVEGRTFTLQTRRGEVLVTWDDETNFRGGTSDDLKEGTKVGVAGERTSGGEGEPPAVHARGIGFKPECGPAELEAS